MTVAEQKRKTLAELAAEAHGDSRGLQCPKCGCRHIPAVFSKPKPDIKTMRQRKCRNCGEKFTTVERVLGYGMDSN